jgi:hypothetical protein
MEKSIPPFIKDALQGAANKYADSPSTTNAGFVLRFLCRFITVDTIAKLLSQKLRKQI